ncbi:MAG: magnesium transporter [Candidatus Omnitrophica bacterium]|nr:magnesium transporter [Candidatus Omnitrophota bacterium]
MEKRVPLLSPVIQEILNSPNASEALKDAFFEMHPYDIYTICEDLADHEIAACVKALGNPLGIALFEEFEDERKTGIFNCFSKEWMADILEQMSHDERADFVKYLPAEKIEEILPLVARAERLDIRKLIQYHEGTAGSILTTDYASLPPEMTVKEAIERLKQQAFDRETIYYVYVVDSERRLLGFVSLRDLIISPSNKTIDDIMHRNVISAHVDDDKEEVARKLSDYDFLAIPIVDNERRLVGIVTVDDVVDVVMEETTEDFYKYGAAGEYIDYLRSNIFQMAQQRTMWLLILICVGFVTGWVIKHNSMKIEEVVALSFFIPLILGAGGNAGTQSSTIVIRELATGNIDIKDVLKVFQKEVSVGLFIGTIMGALAALGGIFMGKNPQLGITVGVSMLCSVILATTLGSFLPILFKRMNLDPALMSGPFITSIVDISSLLIYFKISTIILGL